MRLATADAVQEFFEQRRASLAAAVGEEKADAALAKLSAGWRARAAAAAVMLDPELADEELLETARQDTPRGVALAPGGTPSAAAGRQMQKVRRDVIAVQREVLMRHRDDGTLDETVMRRMLRELDLEEESLSSSWLERVRDV